LVTPFIAKRSEIRMKDEVKSGEEVGESAEILKKKTPYDDYLIVRLIFEYFYATMLYYRCCILCHHLLILFSAKKEFESRIHKLACFITRFSCRIAETN
jgi:hypothetical protein